MTQVSRNEPIPSPLPAVTSCALSVVVGSVNSDRTIVRSLAALEQACAGIDAELIVVDASSDDTAERIRELHGNARVQHLPAGTLTPVLWSTGFAMSRGRAVAFTTGHCVVGEGWARALLAGLESGATGVAGALLLSDESDPVDWALFYLRYSAFLDAGRLETEGAAEIPGDNAAYRREALERHASSFAAGFWEVDFHRRVRAEGARLTFVPGAEVRFGPSAPLGSLARQRFAHGRHSGAWRIHTGVRAAWQILAAAPIVPLVLTARIAVRVLSRRADRARFLAALPALLVLACAWAAGEAWGALAPKGPFMIRKPGLAV